MFSDRLTRTQRKVHFSSLCVNHRHHRVGPPPSWRLGRSERANGHLQNIILLYFCSNIKSARRLLTSSINLVFQKIKKTSMLCPQRKYPSPPTLAPHKALPPLSSPPPCWRVFLIHPSDKLQETCARFSCNSKISCRSPVHAQALKVHRAPGTRLLGCTSK
jgi:hypothetical protein